MTKKTRPATAPSSQTTGKQILSTALLVLYALILSFSFIRVYHDTFDKKINLGGDNAGYYILGTALATGQGYTNIHTLEKTPHNHFPPGYPAIIAVAIKFFHADILDIKKLNGAFLFLSFLLLFLILRKITGNIHIPFITILFLIFNFHLLYYSMIMMSEIPFLFFSTLLLWLFMGTDYSLPVWKNWRFLLLIPLMVFTYMIRSTGLSLFLAFVAWLAWRRKWDYTVALSGGFIVLNIPWFLRSQRLGGNQYIHSMMFKNPYRPELGHMEFTDWFGRIWNNIERYITREIPQGSFNFIHIKSYKDPVLPSEWLYGIFIVLVMIWGLYRLKKFRELIFFYLLFTFGILLLWPPVWTGTRFILPFIPLLFSLFVYGLTDLLILITQRIFRKRVSPEPALIFLTLISLVVIRPYASGTVSYLKRSAQKPYPKKYQNYFDLALWASQHTPDTSVICCRKGQLFYLFSHRYVTGYLNTLDREKQIEYLKRKSTDYVVLDQLGFSSTKRYLFPAIQRYPNKFKTVRVVKDPDTYLLRFLPQYGYWGDWKNNKKEGQGSFVWQDGKKFVGTFRNGKREGPGVIYFPSGFRMEGTWKNDNLEGKVLIRDPAGKIVEIREYKENKLINSQKYSSSASR